jgi:hypothetical protein
MNFTDSLCCYFILLINKIFTIKNRVNTRFQERVARSYGPVKRALDPNNILAPGRSGIDLDAYETRRRVKSASSDES